MGDSAYIFDTSTADFELDVIERSRHTPVLVDFWASWCQPCQMLMPILARIAEAAAGRFYLAKVNADREQALARRYGVRSLPTVVLFQDGAPADQFLGALPESGVRAFLERNLPRPSDAMRERAAALRRAGEAEPALLMLREAATQDPENIRVTFDLLDALVDTNHLEEAEQRLRDLPIATRQADAFRALESQIAVRRRVQQAGTITLEALRARLASNPDDLEARSQLGARLVLDNQLEAAMEQYLEIMRRDRSYDGGVGRKGLLDVFQLLGEGDPRVSRYRRKMASLLY